MSPTVKINLTLYAVRSQDGKWFKSRGYGGYGKSSSWRDNIEEAKLYSTAGTAKSQITYWAKNYPEFGVPDLIEINATSYTVIDQASRVKKVQDKEALIAVQRSKLAAERELDKAQRELEAAKQKLEEAKSQQCQ